MKSAAVKITNLKSKIIDFAEVLACEKTYFSLLGMADLNNTILKILDKNVYFDASILTQKMKSSKYSQSYFQSARTWSLYQSKRSQPGCSKEFHKELHKKIYVPCGCYSSDETNNIKKQKNFSPYYILNVDCKYYISAYRRPGLIDKYFNVPAADLIAAEIFLSCEGKYQINCYQSFMVEGSNIEEKIQKYLVDIKRAVDKILDDPNLRPYRI